MGREEIDCARNFFQTVPKRQGEFNNEEIQTVIDWVKSRIKYEKHHGQGSLDQQLEWFLFIAEIARSDGISGPNSLLKHALLWWASKTENKFGKSYREGWGSGHWAGSFFTTKRLKERAKKKASKRAKDAANALHNKPGSSREKQAAIRAIWATGKYKDRDLCAEQECAALDMSFSTARKALRNTPDNA